MCIRDRLIHGDQPDLSGGIHFVGSARHAVYIEIAAYKKYIEKLRRSMGWPELVPGYFDSIQVDRQGKAA